MNTNYSKTLTKLFDIILDYIENNIQNSNKVIEYKNPINLKKELNLKIKNKPISEEQLINEVENYLKYSVKTGNKQFFNQLYSGFTLPGFIAEILTSITNTSMYTFEVAPVATLIEKELISKMCKIAGFEKGSGIFVTGGSNANLIAMFSARNKVFPNSKNNGLYSTKVLTAFVSDQAHYSFSTAANILGIGADNLIKVKSDKEGKMIINELENAILNSFKKNELPFFIAGTAGTTMLGAFDRFEEISKISKKYNCHFHIDGSFGGSIILSNKKRYLFKGLKQADSFAWNPHKLMNIPLVASVILFNDNKVLKSNLTKLTADYIFHENEEKNCDLGESSIQCGRKNDALKVWLTWKFFGDIGFEKRINNLFEIANYFKSKILEHNSFELMADVQTLTVCFRYNTKNISDLNSFNMKIREELRKSGKSMVNYGYIEKDLTIRFVISNADVTKGDIDVFFQNFIDIAHKINN